MFKEQRNAADVPQDVAWPSAPYVSMYKLIKYWAFEKSFKSIVNSVKIYYLKLIHEYFAIDWNSWMLNYVDIIPIDPV